MSQLPDDIIKIILLYCTEHEVLNFSLVCKEWYPLTREDMIWNQFYVQHWDYVNCKSDESWLDKYKFALKNNSKPMFGYSTGCHNFYSGSSPRWPLKLLWSYSAPQSDIRISKKSLVCDNSQIFFIERKNLICLNLRGEFKWKYEDLFLGDILDEMIEVYVPKRILICNVGSSAIAALDMSSRQVWRFTISDSVRFSRFVIRNGVIIFNVTCHVGDKDITTIFGLNIDDGTVYWKVSLPDHINLSQICVSDQLYVVFTRNIEAVLLCMRFKNGFDQEPKYGYLDISDQVTITNLVFSFPQLMITGEALKNKKHYLLFADIEQRACDTVATAKVSINVAYDPIHELFYYSQITRTEGVYSVAKMGCKGVDKTLRLRARQSNEMMYHSIGERDSLDRAQWGTKWKMELHVSALSSFVLTKEMFFTNNLFGEKRKISNHDGEESDMNPSDMNPSPAESVRSVFDSSLLAVNKKDFVWEFYTPIVGSGDLDWQRKKDDGDSERLFLWNSMVLIVSKDGILVCSNK
jgi:hypothetical protein